MTPTSRQIRELGAPAAIFWALAIVWTGVSLIVYLSQSQPSNLTFISLIFAGVFAAISLILFSVAIYQTLTLVAYGRSVFDSAAIPAFCGGVLTGTIRTAKPFIFREPINLRLTCLMRIRTGKNSQQVPIWEDHLTLDRFPPGSPISEIPVFFKIPTTARPSEPRQILWRLDARAKTTGVHYSSVFRVPIAAGPIPTQFSQPPDPTLPFRSHDPAHRQPLDRHIHLSPLPAGGCQIELLPGRNFAMALITMFIGLIFVFAGQVLRTLSANSIPLIFTSLFSAMGAIPFLIGLRLLFLKTTLVIRRGEITIETASGPFTSRKAIHANDVSEITKVFQGQFSGNPYYAINATTPGPIPIKLCGTIYTREDADWIVEIIKTSFFGIGTIPTNRAQNNKFPQQGF